MRTKLTQPAASGTPAFALTTFNTLPISAGTPADLTILFTVPSLGPLTLLQIQLLFQGDGALPSVNLPQALVASQSRQSLSIIFNFNPLH